LPIASIERFEYVEALIDTAVHDRFLLERACPPGLRIG
jgi:hypothetical protein